MKQSNDYKLSLMLIVVVSMIIMGSNSTKADFTFGEPENLGSVLNTTVGEGGMCISPDDLTLYFSTGYTGSVRPGGLGEEDIWMTTRTSSSQPWGTPVNLGSPINSSASEAFASISADGLTLYFCDFFYGSARPGGVGGKDLWMSTRTSRNDPWSAPVNMGSIINSNDDDITPTTSADGLTLIFASNRGSGGWQYDLWMSTRVSTDGEWGTPVNMGSTINSSSYDGAANLSSDSLVLFFASNRPEGMGSDDIWMTIRKTVNDPWESPVNLGAVINTNVDDTAPAISADGRTLYFDSQRPGGFGSYDLWQVSITPNVDFNGDGIVDIDDLVIMIENWGTNESLCDIGPMPWGDGIVDRKDLEVFMSHWGENYILKAHWKLDETDGGIAYDSIGENDGTLYGDPNWRPYDGIADGALEFDGINDYLATPFVVNPATGPFSIFAWIKGGLPGQIIISQADGANWLSANISDGALMTELKGGGRTGSILVSQTVITDDNWHLIGLTWDGANRILYVDGIVAAQDTQANLIGSDGGLLIGTGNIFTTGDFWNGLIDDVQIYNQAITP